MAVFAYKAIDSVSGEVTGTVAADTPRQARDALRERGLSVRALEDVRPEQPRIGRGRWLGRTRGSETTLFIRELSTLLAIGMPMLEALDTVARQHTGRFHAVVLLLRERLAGGASLAQAMREQGGAFDELCANIAEVGEDAGTLDASLERLAEFRERVEQLKGRVTTALIYPAIVLSTAVAATLFLMTFVVPRILEPLVEQGHALPLPTRVVKGASDFVLAWWWVIALAAAGGAAALAALFRTDGGRWWWDRAVLRLPLMGELVRKQAVVRIAVVVGTLLRSGVVFLRALEIAQRTTANRVLRDALRRCEQAVAAGGEIAEALSQTRAFPAMVVQVFALGQQSGRLEEMLDRLATVYDRQVQSTAQRIAAVVEPLIILLLALIVLFIVLATVLPILEAGHAIQ
jgi:type II secretory pathway component PulF